MATPGKRKAEDQLTRNTNFVIEPYSVRTKVRKVAWTGVKYLTWATLSIYRILTTGTPGEVEAPDHTHVQIETARGDGTSAVKRLRTAGSSRPWSSYIRIRTEKHFDALYHAATNEFYGPYIGAYPFDDDIDMADAPPAHANTLHAHAKATPAHANTLPTHAAVEAERAPTTALEVPHATSNIGQTTSTTYHMEPVTQPAVVEEMPLCTIETEPVTKERIVHLLEGMTLADLESRATERKAVERAIAPKESPYERTKRLEKEERRRKLAQMFRDIVSEPLPELDRETTIESESVTTPTSASVIALSQTQSNNTPHTFSQVQSNFQQVVPMDTAPPAQAFLPAQAPLIQGLAPTPSAPQNQPVAQVQAVTQAQAAPLQQALPQIHTASQSQIAPQSQVVTNNQIINQPNNQPVTQSSNAVASVGPRSILVQQHPNTSHIIVKNARKKFVHFTPEKQLDAMSLDEVLSCCFGEEEERASRLSMSLEPSSSMQTRRTYERQQKEAEEREQNKLLEEKRRRQVDRARRHKLREDAVRAQRELEEKRIQELVEARILRRDPHREFIPSLNQKWDTMVDEALKLNPGEKADIKVVATTCKGADIRVKDMMKLLGRGQWLNDETVNAYIEWVADAGNKAAAAKAEGSGQPVSKVPKFIAHSSFFYPLITDPKKGPTSTQRLMKRLKAPGVALLEVDTIFIPICKGNHWTLGVVRPVAKTIEYFDSLSNGLSSDSLEFEKLMRSWLAAQLGSAYKDYQWSNKDTKCVRQLNGHDCGVMVCTNAFCVARGVHPDSYGHSQMTQQRKNIGAILLNEGFHGEFSWEHDRI